MTLEDFKGILIKEKGGNFAFSLEDSNIVSNGIVSLKNDPNFRKYFGDFLFQQRTVFGLDIGGRMKFSGEKKPRYDFWDVFKDMFKESQKYETVTVPEKRIEGRYQIGCSDKYVKNACALSVEDKGFVIVDMDYLDYLDKVGYDSICLPAEDSKLIQFTKDGNTRATLYLLRTSQAVDNFRVYTKEELTSLFDKSRV